MSRGEVAVLIGSSGSGKSTLLRCISGLEPFERGQLSVADQILRGTEHSSWTCREQEHLRNLRIRVGMVFQQFNLFPHRTVLENVIEGPTQVLGIELEEATLSTCKVLERVRMEALSDRYPANLSGGEQQRVAIARALAMEPRVILFDEPTSALDPETVGDVLDVLRSLAKEGRTMLIATHEMQFAREVADSIHMLDAGRIIESGKPNEMFQSPKTERTRNFLKRILKR